METTSYIRATRNRKGYDKCKKLGLWGELLIGFLMLLQLLFVLLVAFDLPRLSSRCFVYVFFMDH